MENLVLPAFRWYHIHNIERKENRDDPQDQDEPDDLGEALVGERGRHGNYGVCVPEHLIKISNLSRAGKPVSIPDPVKKGREEDLPDSGCRPGPLNASQAMSSGSISAGNRK